ncbi:MAG: hypothetical protein AB8G86_10970 [Saprospiraceae bacterium]
MATISISKKGTVIKEKTKNVSLISRYIAYTEKQQAHSVYWYMLTIMIFTCGVMIPSIFVMGKITDNYVWFMSLSVLLFYANVMAHIGETKSTFFVPLYHLTTLFMIAVPVITYFMQ